MQAVVHLTLKQERVRRKEAVAVAIQLVLPLPLPLLLLSPPLLDCFFFLLLQQPSERCCDIDGIAV
jgi:hypothetical protein